MGARLVACVLVLCRASRPAARAWAAAAQLGHRLLCSTPQPTSSLSHRHAGAGTGKLNGRSEQLLGRFLDGYPGSGARRDSVRIATKLAAYPWRLTPKQWVGACRASLARTGQERLALAQLHWSTANYAPLQERLMWDGLVAIYEEVSEGGRRRRRRSGVLLRRHRYGRLLHLHSCTLPCAACPPAQRCSAPSLAPPTTLHHTTPITPTPAGSGGGGGRVQLRPPPAAAHQRVSGEAGRAAGRGAGAVLAAEVRGDMWS